MKSNVILIIAILINSGFFTGFFIKFKNLHTQIKRNSYSSGVFRQIDEGNKFEFLKLSILAFSNVIVLIYSIYEINH